MGGREQASRGEESRPADHPADTTNNKRDDKTEKRRRTGTKQRGEDGRGGRKGKEREEGGEEAKGGRRSRKERGEEAKEGTQRKEKTRAHGTQSETTSRGKSKSRKDERTSWSRPRHSRAWLCAYWAGTAESWCGRRNARQDSAIVPRRARATHASPMKHGTAHSIYQHVPDPGREHLKTPRP